jgi:hypothetical protein
MSKYEMVAFIVFVTTAGATISSIARAYIRRLELKSQPRPTTSLADEERLERIERAVEAVAIEVERISEGQRFTTRLLADRNGSLPGSGAPAGSGMGGHRGGQ